MTEQRAPYAIQKQDDKLKDLMHSEEIKSRFAEVVGGMNAGGYISSVLIAVSESEALQKCSPVSIIGAALRAATMRLSVEPSTGQAYLVPFKGRATLIVGYKGIYHMALRTWKYRFINLITVYEGEQVKEDRMTGLHTLIGNRTSDKSIGYMLYFQLLNGFQKTFYMTNEEIEEHGAHYSKTYNYNDSPWKTETEKMYKKTVMRLGLTRWGYLEPSDLQAMTASDEDNTDLANTIDAVARDLPAEKPRIPVDQATNELGFYDEPKEQEKPAPVTVDPKEVSNLASKRGVSSKGLEELYTKNGGNANAVYEQLLAL